jgi:hypothetical protein
MGEMRVGVWHVTAVNPMDIINVLSPLTRDIVFFLFNGFVEFVETKNQLEIMLSEYCQDKEIERNAPLILLEFRPQVGNSGTTSSHASVNRLWRIINCLYF